MSYKVVVGDKEYIIRELPNGVKDEIKISENQYIKRIEEIKLNGSRNWGNYTVNAGTNINTISFSLKISPISPNLGNVAQCFSDSFNSVSADYLYGNDTECVAVKGDLIRIRINRNKLATEDIIGFKTWLESNQITLDYQLAESIVTNIETEGSENSLAGKEFNRQTSIMANVAESYELIDIMYDNLLNPGDSVSTYIYAEKNEVIEVETFKTLFNVPPSTLGATSGTQQISISSFGIGLLYVTNNYNSNINISYGEVVNPVTMYPADNVIANNNIKNLKADENTAIVVTYVNNTNLAYNVNQLSNKSQEIQFFIKRKKVKNN